MGYMENVALLTVVGGLVFALSIRLLSRRSRDPIAAQVDARLAPPNAIINMAHIDIAGVGGLGMVAMAAVVAIFLPGVRRSILAGLVCGAVMAAVMIYRRRQAGPLSSSSKGPGAHTMLVSEGESSAAATETRHDDRALLAGASA